MGKRSSDIRKNKIIKHIVDQGVMLVQPEVNMAGQPTGRKRRVLYINNDIGSIDDNTDIAEQVDHFIVEDKQWSLQEPVIDFLPLEIDSAEAQQILHKIRENDPDMQFKQDHEIYEEYKRSFEKESNSYYIIASGNDDLEEFAKKLTRIELHSPAVEDHFNKQLLRYHRMLKLLGEDLVSVGDNDYLPKDLLFKYRGNKAFPKEFRDDKKWLLSPDEVAQLGGHFKEGDVMIRIREPHEVANEMVLSHEVRDACRDLDFGDPQSDKLKVVRPSRQVGE